MGRCLLVLALVIGMAAVGRADDGKEPRLLAFAGWSSGRIDSGEWAWGGEVGAEFLLTPALSLEGRVQHLRGTHDCRIDGQGRYCLDEPDSRTSGEINLKITTRRDSIFSGYLSPGIVISHHRRHYRDSNLDETGRGLSLGAGLAVRLHSRLHLYVEGRYGFYNNWPFDHPGRSFHPDLRVGLQYGF